MKEVVKLADAAGAGAGVKGIATDESLDYFGGQLAYATDSYGVSATFSTNEDGVDSEVKYLAFKEKLKTIKPKLRYWKKCIHWLRGLRKLRGLLRGF